MAQRTNARTSLPPLREMESSAIDSMVSNCRQAVAPEIDTFILWVADLRGREPEGIGPMEPSGGMVLDGPKAMRQKSEKVSSTARKQVKEF